MVKYMSKKGKVSVELHLEVRDKYGRLIKKRKVKSKSLVANFMKLINIRMHNKTETLKDTGGTEHSVAPGDVTLCEVEAPEGNDTFGILIGMDMTSPTANDYKLWNQILHGTGANQMTHRATSCSGVTVADPDSYVEISRLFINESGADIDVNECGFAYHLTVGGVDIFVLVCRDVVSPTVTVPDGGTLTVKYTVKVSA